MSAVPGRWFCLSLALLVWSAVTAFADDPMPPVKEVKLPEIADEPKLIDPATVMPAKLAAATTVDLSNSSLREVIDWLRDVQKLTVFTEQSTLAEAGILPSEPVSDRLDNAPLYLLLNRLHAFGVAWYIEDEILHITSQASAEEHLTTVPYNLGELLDTGYRMDELTSVIDSTISPESWDAAGGSAVLSSLGDVLFVRQTDEVHRKVQGLLAALRKHGRQTMILEPPQHLLLRQKLEQNTTVDFRETPLDAALGQVAKELQIDLRLDMPVLRTIRFRERQPVTLKLTNRKLKTVLQAMVMDFDLTWILRDGVLWITSADTAEAFLKTAVYDVRDLCRDDDESDALREAIMSQSAELWDAAGGPGTIRFAKPGTLVVHNQEKVLHQVLDLLESYRTALRVSRPRDRNAVDRNEVITVYYRLHANVAESLQLLLQKLVQPASWKSSTRPEAPGEFFLVASPPDLFSPEGQLLRAASKDPTDAQNVVVARAVLVVRQTRAVHDEIAEIIRRIESGDTAKGAAGGLGGGLGSGGFGGGFFSVPAIAGER